METSQTESRWTMAQIGSYGDIVFQVSDKSVLTPSKLRQKVSGQWGKHKPIMKKPRPEFGGADARGITFTIILDATLGVRPRKVLERIEEMIEEGFVDYMVIGNKTMGNNRFAITAMTEEWDVVYNGGELAKATLNITLEEYT